MPGPRTKLYKYVCLITLDIKYEKVSQKRHRSILGKVDNGFGCRYNPTLSSESVDLLLGKPYKGYGTEESFDHTSESSFLMIRSLFLILTANRSRGHKTLYGIKHSTLHYQQRRCEVSICGH
jgi:hypothetical protein